MTATLTLFKKYTRKALVHPEQIFGMLLQPILWVALFGLGMKNLMGSAMLDTDGSYLTFILPGIIALTALGGAIGGGTGWLFERTQGLVKEYLVAPIPRVSILFGNALSIISKVLVQSLIILVLGVLLGARLTGNPIGWFVGMLYVVGFGIGFSGIALALASKTDSAEAYHMMIFMLNLPLLFLSNALYPMEVLPKWMQIGAMVNPTTYAISGMRQTMMSTSNLAAADNLSLWLSAVVMFGFAVIGMFLALRAFRSAVR